jgi:hypothetical protein
VSTLQGFVISYSEFTPGSRFPTLRVHGANFPSAPTALETLFGVVPTALQSFWSFPRPEGRG